MCLCDCYWGLRLTLCYQTCPVFSWNPDQLLPFCKKNIWNPTFKKSGFQMVRFQIPTELLSRNQFENGFVRVSVVNSSLVYLFTHPPSYTLNLKLILTSFDSIPPGSLVNDSCYFALSESGIVYSWADESTETSSKSPHLVERLQVRAILSFNILILKLKNLFRSYVAWLIAWVWTTELL